MRSTLAPGGRAAACLCNESNGAADGHTVYGVHTAPEVPGCSTWLTAVAHEERPLTSGRTAQGWGRRFFGILYQDHAEPGLFAQVYDCQADCWQPQLKVPQSKSRTELKACLPVTLCDSDELLAVGAGTLSSGGRLAAALIICGTTAPFEAVSYCQHLYDYRWLPGSTSLLVLGQGAMARLDFDPAVPPISGVLELHWVHLPAVVGTPPCDFWHQPPSMDVIPGTLSAILLCSWDTAEGASVCLTPYDAADMVAGISRHETIPDRLTGSDFLNGQRDRHHSVLCSRKRVAVCLKSAVVYLYELAGDRISQVVARTEYLECLSFSACNLLAGWTKSKIIVVVDARQGTLLARITRRVIGKAGHLILSDCGAWTGQ